MTDIKLEYDFMVGEGEFPWHVYKFTSSKEMSKSLFNDAVNYIPWYSIDPILVLWDTEGYSHLESVVVGRNDFFKEGGRYNIDVDKDGNEFKFFRVHCTITGDIVWVVNSPGQGMFDLITVCGRISEKEE